MREKRQTHWISRRTPLNNEVKTEPDNIKKPEITSSKKEKDEKEI
jgi:hypothetical protein